MEATVALNETRRSENFNDFGDTKELRATVKENMSLIDRFYHGGNAATPEALHILVVVLDTVVSRMRRQRDARQRQINDIDAELKRIDSSLASIRKLQSPLERELAEKRSLAKELESTIEYSVSTVNDSAATARQAVVNARIAQRVVEKNLISATKLSTKGFDANGRPLPGTP